MGILGQDLGGGGATETAGRLRGTEKVPTAYGPKAFRYPQEVSECRGCSGRIVPG